MKRLLLLALVWSGPASAQTGVDSQVIAEQAVQIRMLKDQVIQLQKQVQDQTTTQTQRALTAEARVAQICSICSGKVAVAAPTMTPPQVVREWGPSNVISLLAGSGPDGVKTTKDPVTGHVSAEANVAPIFGLEYSRVVYETWVANIIVTRGTGSSTTYTGLAGVGFGF